MADKKILTVDEILDGMEYSRTMRAEIYSQFRGKGAWEDKPEQGYTSSAFWRGKFGDYEEGYFDKKEKR